jgi:hypothetical protein
MHGEVEQMFNEGILKRDEEGRYVAVTDPDESNHIRSSIASASKNKPDNRGDAAQITS